MQYNEPLAVRKEALERFWVGEGCKVRDAAQLADFCISEGGRVSEPDALCARLERWRRVLPGVSIAAIATRFPHIVAADIAIAIQCMLALSRVLGRNVDVLALVEAHPPLLWAGGQYVEEAATTAMQHLQRWSPRSDPSAILENYPELILRIPKYYADMEFFQLPLQIQNVMAVGGGGGGTHYRSWAGDDDEADALEWAAEDQSDSDNNTD